MGQFFYGTSRELVLVNAEWWMMVYVFSDIRIIYTHTHTQTQNQILIDRPKEGESLLKFIELY